MPSFPCTCSKIFVCQSHRAQPPVCAIPDCPCCLKDTPKNQQLATLNSKVSPNVVRNYYDSVVASYQKLIQKTTSQRNKYLARIQQGGTRYTKDQALLLHYLQNGQSDKITGQLVNKVMTTLDSFDQQQREMLLIKQAQQSLSDQYRQLSTKLMIGKDLNIQNPAHKHSRSLTIEQSEETVEIFEDKLLFKSVSAKMIMRQSSWGQYDKER